MVTLTLFYHFPLTSWGGCDIMVSSIRAVTITRRVVEAWIKKKEWKTSWKS